jgi:hypothetical protein
MISALLLGSALLAASRDDSGMAPDLAASWSP